MEIRLAAAMEELNKEVTCRHGEVTVSGTCVNVHLPNGTMMLTPCYETQLHNALDCLEFVQTCRIGQIWPVCRPAISNLGEIATAVRIVNQKFNQLRSDISEDLDAFRAPGECWNNAFNGFDEGFEDAIRIALAAYDLTPEEYNDELSRRITMNYKRHCTIRA
jgi:hypothetical protein